MASSPQSVDAPRPALMWCLAVLPVIAAYANVGTVGFMWDDHVLIEQNTDLHSLHAPWTYLTRAFWQHPFFYGQGIAYYRPLVIFTLALDWALGGGGPLLFHLTNLALHLGVCSLVFFVALRRSQSASSATVVTMLFGVMPRLTESVTWVVGRTDVLATLFVLLALMVGDAKRPAVRWLSGVLVLLALLAKEVALLGVAVLFAEAGLRWLRRARPLREELPVVLSTVLAVLMWALLRSSAMGSSELRLHGAQTFLAGVGHYVFMVLTPWRPVAQIGWVRDPETWAIALGLSALAAAGVMSWRWLRSPEPWRAVWLGAALGGVMMVSLVRLPVFTIASDRFLYFPLAFGAVLAAQRPWRRGLLVAGVMVSLVLALVTSRRNEVWADPLRFWQEVHDTASPHNPGAFAGLADVLMELTRLEEARALYVQAEAARGSQRDSPTRLSLAVVESRLGNDATALALLGTIIEENPDWRRARYDLVLFRARALDFAGARAAVREARARFGDDEVLRDFDMRLDEQEGAVVSPKPLERARALHSLGATAKAERLYEPLLSDPEARQEAARWLVLFGRVGPARQGLEVLGGDAVARETLAERFPS